MSAPFASRAALALVLLAVVGPSSARAPATSRRLPAPIRRELGRDWTVRVLDSTADFDRDGHRDLLVVAVGTEAPIDSSTGVPWNPNPWRLLVALHRREPGGWTVVADNGSLIPPPLSAFQFEPFNSVSTDSGNLRVDLCQAMIAGTWEASETSLEFRWTDGAFRLERWRREATNRGTGSSTTTEVDLPRGTLRRSFAPGESDSLEPREDSSSLPPQAGPALSDMDNGLEYAPAGIDPP